jgi:hypothetical protein
MNAREKRTDYPTITNDEFRNRIRKLLGIPDEVTGAKKTNPALVRQPTDKGYYPPKKETSK